MAEYVKQLQREMGRRQMDSTPSANLMAAAQAAQAAHVAQAAQVVQAAQAAAHHAATGSPPSKSPNQEAALFDMSRLSLWNSLYNNNMHPALGYAHLSPPQGIHSPMPQLASPEEPQKEALDLGLR